MSDAPRPTQNECRWEFKLDSSLTKYSAQGGAGKEGFRNSAVGSPQTRLTDH